MYFMMGAPEGSTESGSGEAGNHPATPGLQGIRLINYTTAASLFLGTEYFHTYV